MVNQKVAQLQTAIGKIQEAKTLIREALLDTDSDRVSVDMLNSAIYALECDIQKMD